MEQHVQKLGGLDFTEETGRCFTDGSVSVLFSVLVVLSSKTNTLFSELVALIAISGTGPVLNSWSSFS